MRNIHKYQFRYQIISLVDRGIYTALQAAWELNLSIRHIRRLLAKFRDNQKKYSSLLPKDRPPAWNGKTEDIVKEIVRLKLENPRRSNQCIAEVAAGKFGKKISYQTVRSVLIKNDCYEKSKTERRVFCKMEENITHSGQMVQFDACEGAWVTGYRRVYLIAFMDAYSRYILSWKWVDSYTAWNNILVLRSLIEKYGVPEVFYTDNASFYKVIRHNQSVYQNHKPDDQYETTIRRIIVDMGSIMINHKPYQPQGKGRIERFFQFMQDRFIKEHTATNLKELNQQFSKWIKWYNEKHVIRTIKSSPKNRLDPKGFKPVPEDLVSERVFSYQYTRKVGKYNDFSFQGNEYIIKPENCKYTNGCLAARTVQLYVTPETIVVYHHDLRLQEFKNLSNE